MRERDLENEGVREGNMNSEKKNMLYYPPRFVPAEGNDMSSESSLFVIGDKNDMWPFLPPELWSLLKGDDTSFKSRSLMQPLRMHDYIPLSELGVNDMSSKSWRINLEKSPALTERRDAEHGSCLLRARSKPSSQSLLCM